MPRLAMYHGTLKEEKMLTVKYPVGMNDGYVKVFSKLEVSQDTGILETLLLPSKQYYHTDSKDKGLI